MGEVSCDNCSHKEACIEEYGPKREDGDDYRAVIGTHHCLASWNDFRCCNCKNKEGG